MELKDRLVEIVGKKDVLDSPGDLKTFSRDYSFAKSAMPDFVVRPRNSGEIASLVKLANETGLPLIPSSSSLHFYGATIPKFGGAVVDLSPMNRILGVDERNRLAKIEPGVSWGKLSQELEKRGLFAVPPLLPHPGRSVLTTYLEREPLVIPRYEFGDPLLGMEVVWPNGDIFRTGSASAPGFPDSFCQGANPSGPGCMDFYRLLQGAQGTFGIVAWANIKVEYLPTVNKSLFIPFNNLEEAPGLLYRIGKLRIGYEYFLLNSINWAILFGDGGIEEIKALSRALPSYIFTITLSGIRRHPEEKVAYEEKALDTMMATEFKYLQKLSFSPGLPGLERKLPAILRQPYSVNGTYWKFKYQGAVQELFFIATMERSPALICLAREEAGRRGFPLENLGVYIQPIDYGSGCHCQLNFYYNSSDERMKEQLMKAYDAVAETLLEQGAHFTRPYGSLAGMVYNKALDYVDILKRAKSLFDPNNIMCPGNLCF